MKNLQNRKSFLIKENQTVNLEQELNIVDDINRKDINGEVPSDAEYAMLNPTEKFIEKFYKFEEVKFNTGETENALNYYSERGIWQPSLFNNTYYEKLSDAKFLKIVD